MASKSKCKIELPSQLPESGLTRVQFKAWKETMSVYLKQNDSFSVFFPGGIYDTWSSAADNADRIQLLHERDHQNNQNANNEKLSQRRKDLHAMLSIIGGKCDQYDYDDILNMSTSLQSIWSMIELAYDIGRKGVNFLELNKLKYNKTESPIKFYKRIYHHIMDNLYKRGDVFKNKTFVEDESMTATLLNFMLFYTLETIDSRLTQQVKEKWGHVLDDSKSIHEMKDIILKAVPDMIVQLDTRENEVNSLAALTAANKNQNKSRKQRPNSKSSNYTRLFCRLCQTAGDPKRVYSTHNIGNCRRWTKKDVEDLRVMMCELKTDPNDFDNSSSESESD